jgi:hypothetical protein
MVETAVLFVDDRAFLADHKTMLVITVRRQSPQRS